MQNSYPPRPLSSGERLAAMFLDHLFMCLFLAVLCAPLMMMGMASAFTAGHHVPSSLDNAMVYFLVPGITLYICKDSFGGRSLAKRLVKQQVAVFATGHTAGPLRCFVRNLFIGLWPLEVLMVLNNPERRIGDLVAGTYVVRYDPDRPNAKNHKRQLLIYPAFVGFLFLLFCINSHTKKLYSHRLETLNGEVSRQTEKLFADSLSKFLVPEAWVYDSVDNKYNRSVYVILNLKANYNDESCNRFFEKGKTLLQQKFPDGRYTGIIRANYGSGPSMITRSIDVDGHP